MQLKTYLKKILTFIHVIAKTILAIVGEFFDGLLSLN